MAANGIAFAQFCFRIGNNADPSNKSVRGVAVVVATFACTIHAVSRRGGIYLSNILAIIKVFTLLLIFATGIAASAGAFPNHQISIAHPPNLSSTHDSFPTPAKNAYGYAEAFLSVLFAYAGWNQANYVSQQKPRHPCRNGVGTSVEGWNKVLLEPLHLTV